MDEQLDFQLSVLCPVAAVLGVLQGRLSSRHGFFQACAMRIAVHPWAASFVCTSNVANQRKSNPQRQLFEEHQRHLVRHPPLAFDNDGTFGACRRLTFRAMLLPIETMGPLLAIIVPMLTHFAALCCVHQ